MQQGWWWCCFKQFSSCRQLVLDSLTYQGSLSLLPFTVTHSTFSSYRLKFPPMSDRMSLHYSFWDNFWRLTYKTVFLSLTREWGHLRDFKLPCDWDWIDPIDKMCKVYSLLDTLGYSLMPSYLTDLDSAPSPSLAGKRTSSPDSSFSYMKRKIAFIRLGHPL